MTFSMAEEVRTCVRCGRPVIRQAERFEVFEQMHWSRFHYEFEHLGAGSADDDPDIACKDPACPARALIPRLNPTGSPPADLERPHYGTTELHLPAVRALRGGDAGAI